MSAHAIASKFRRALRNGTGASFTGTEIAEMRELGLLAEFGILPSSFVAPPPLIKWPWPDYPVVYFIGPHDGPVKVGFATDLRARFRHLRYMSPSPLHIWGYVAGSMDLEKAYHMRFAASRRHGEWFDRTAGLAAEISRLCMLSAS